MQRADRITHYANAPSTASSMKEFEECGIERVNVLQLFRNTSFSDCCDGTTQQFPISNEQDNFSHFVLRLAVAHRCLQSPEDTYNVMYEWCTLETKLFMHRLSTVPLEDLDSIKKLYADFNIDVDLISMHSLPKAVAEIVRAWHFQKKDYNIIVLDTSKHMHCFPTKYLKLRQFYLQSGLLYLPLKYWMYLLQPAFTNHLKKQVKVLSATLKRNDNHDIKRLATVLESISQKLVGRANTTASSQDALGDNKIAIEDLDSLSKTCYPLCMSMIHQSLRQKNHLKYEGRQQYQLFLKGLGLKVEENLEFWKTAFAVGHSEFERKKYAYNIRYLYGLEGQRKDFKPYDCRQVMAIQAPSAGQCHGCPYKNLDSEGLKQKLLGTTSTIDSQLLEKILELKQEGKFLSACNAHLRSRSYYYGSEATSFSSTLHPNSYFADAYRSSFTM